MTPPDIVNGWVLAGGLGSRMGGVDKGLQPYQGQPLAAHVLSVLTPQVTRVGISANRNGATYRDLLRNDAVFTDDADLPANSGPLAGILTGLRHMQGDWLMVAPCDSPHLPVDLVARLWMVATKKNLEIVTPVTKDRGEDRPHWACSLIHTRVCPKLQEQFVKGERKVGRFIQSLNWAAVPFEDPFAFSNMNTLESLHGRV